MEEIIMNLIVYSGETRSFAMEAIATARMGDTKKAEELMNESKNSLGKAHDIQTKLIQDEAAGKKCEISLLLVHAQDHLMNAISIQDLAKEFIELYKNK